MRIEVTVQDIERAESSIAKISADPGYREHNWHNPLAYAIARTLGENYYATVSSEWICVADRAERYFRLTMSGEPSVFRREWLRGVAQPTVFDFPGITR